MSCRLSLGTMHFQSIPPPKASSEAGSPMPDSHPGRHVWTGEDPHTGASRTTSLACTAIWRRSRVMAHGLCAVSCSAHMRCRTQKKTCESHLFCAALPPHLHTSSIAKPNSARTAAFGMALCLVSICSHAVQTHSAGIVAAMTHCARREACTHPLHWDTYLQSSRDAHPQPCGEIAFAMQQCGELCS